MIELSLNIGIGFLILTFILSMIRLVKGPTLQDRVVALDMIGAAVSGLIIIYFFKSENPRYIDIVVVLSLILFLGTTTVARFLNKEKK